MPKPLPRLIKCRYCEWTTKRWTKAKDGHSKSGLARLANHVEVKHGMMPDANILFGDGRP